MMMTKGSIAKQRGEPANWRRQARSPRNVRAHVADAPRRERDWRGHRPVIHGMGGAVSQFIA